MKRMYYILMLLAGVFFFAACDKEETKIDNTIYVTPTTPAIKTVKVTDIDPFSANIVIKLTTDGYSPVIVGGVVYGTAAEPTIEDGRTYNEVGQDTMEVYLDHLASNTKYYVRAYVKTEKGLTYGEELNFTTGNNVCQDKEGNVYKTVKIGSQIWMAENLRATKYRGGTNIAATDTMPPNNSHANVAAYGYLYRWAACVDSIAPVGYRVATDADWVTLYNYVVGYTGSSGKYLKDETFGGVDYFEFDVKGSGKWPTSNFGNNAYYWTPDYINDTYGYVFSFSKTSSSMTVRSNTLRTTYASIRCVKE